MPTLEAQIKLEEQAILDTTRKVESLFIDTINKGRFTESNIGQPLLRISIPLVESKLKELFTVPARGKIKGSITVIKSLFEGDEKKLAFVVLNSLLAKVSVKPIGLVSLATKIMKDIEAVLLVERFKEDNPKLYSYLEYENKKRSKALVNKKKLALAKLKGYNSLDVEFTTKIGLMLIDVVINSGCNLFEMNQKALDASKTLFLSKQAIEVITKKKEALLLAYFKYNPLVFPPKEHTELMGSGGYYSYSNISLVKANSKHLNIIARDFNNNKRILHLLNSIQQTKWRINTRVLEVVEDIISSNIINSKTPVTNPVLLGNIPFMENLDIDKQIPKEIYGRTDDSGRFLEDEAYDKWYTDRVNQEAINEKIISKRLSYLCALAKAKQYKEYDCFYFTYQFDYRYRLYPIQEHLQPQASSNIKALLEFAEGQVLDEQGLYWFKIHGANCYGKDKVCYDERVKFIEEQTTNIKQLVKDPLTYDYLWKEADEPLLYLAFCFAYVDYLNNPTTTIHIPVQLDATCSGLQIYSGLLRDADGAKAVNVIGQHREDVYQKVADKVNEYLEKGELPTEVFFKTKDGEEKIVNVGMEARSMKGNITRKLVKRNVMTTPYSVTKRGMFDQIKEILDEQEISDNAWWKGDRWIVAKLLTDLNSKAIAEIVKGAIVGQKFIKEVTQHIARNNQYLVWKGATFSLPMVHRMPQETKERVTTPFGRLCLYKPTDKLNTLKMLSSIAPNFIHHLDSVLMYRTVELCLEEGIDSFWLIHDSYGVLPNHIEILNKNVRKAFVELFSTPILKDWVAQVAPDKVKEVDYIMINTLDLGEVKDSLYIFS